MGLLERLNAEKRDTSTLGNPSQWLIEALGASPSATGIHVTPVKARGLAAAYACMNVLAQDVAKLPLKVFERIERGRRPAPEHYLWAVLHDRSNPFMTAYTFLSTLQWHLAGWGNAYAEIEWDGAFEKVLGLWPLLPDCTYPEWVDGRKVYRTSVWEDGAQRQVRLPADRVLHVLGPSYDGIVGVSPVTDARHAIALGLASQEFGSRFFSNGLHSGMVAYHPGAINDAVREKIRAGIEVYTKGLESSHRIAVLEDGIKLEKLGVAPEAAQMIETRRFTLEEMCRFYRMPPHKVQHLERATFSNIEHQAIEYLQDCLQPWLVNWEQAINSALFAEAERGRYYVKFLEKALLRGDQKSSNESKQIAILGGWMSPNEARELDDMNPLPPEKGDVYILPANYTRSELLGQPGQAGAPALPKEPEPPPASPDESEDDEDEDRSQGSPLERACRRVLELTFSRSTRREVLRIRKLARDWMEGRLTDAPAFLAAARRELDELEGMLRTELAVVVEAFDRFLPAGFAREFVRATRAEVERELVEVAGSGPSAVLDRAVTWEETKASVLARLALESGRERNAV